MRDDVSFASLFKPDDAVSLSTTETERNWNTVFAEVVTVPREADLPVAHAVTVDEEIPPSMTPTHAIATSGPTNDGTTLHHCTFLNIVIGYSHLIIAVSTAFATELAGATVCLVGVGFYWVSQNLKEHCGTWTLPLATLTMILTAFMLAIDLLVLTLGIFLVELVAWIACGLCMMFGGASAGMDWHQHIRKICHLTRWAFRGFHSSWLPKRVRPFNSPGDAIENEKTTFSGGPQPSKTDCEVTVEDESVGKDKDENYTEQIM